MDFIIFLKAIGNLLFMAILFVAVLLTSAFSVLTYLLKGCKPAVTGFKSMVQSRFENGMNVFQLGKKILPQKKF